MSTEGFIYSLNLIRHDWPSLSRTWPVHYIRGVGESLQNSLETFLYNCHSRKCPVINLKRMNKGTAVHRKKQWEKICSGRSQLVIALELLHALGVCP